MAYLLDADVFIQVKNLQPAAVNTFLQIAPQKLAPAGRFLWSAGVPPAPGGVTDRKNARGAGGTPALHKRHAPCELRPNR